MAKNDRFEIIHQEGNGLTKPQCLVLMDSATGVQYLFVQSGYGGGLCPWWTRRAAPSRGTCEQARRRAGAETTPALRGGALWGKLRIPKESGPWLTSRHDQLIMSPDSPDQS